MRIFSTIPRLTCVVYALCTSVHATTDQQQVLTPTADPPNVASLSSLFLQEPSAVTPAPCCGTNCGPNQCNIRLPPLSTDLAYLFPIPTTAPPARSKIVFPCCGPSCPDGCCRRPTAFSSERPHPPAMTSNPQPGPGDRLIPDPSDDDPLGVVIGCCKGCRGCRQSAQGDSDDGETMTATDMMRMAATDAAANAIPTGDADELRRAPHGHLANSVEICIGCVGGKCYPCRQKVVETMVSFTPAVGAGATATAPTGPDETSGGGQESAVPEPTLKLGKDYADAIQGRNQDVVPVVAQSYADTAAGKEGAFELITLLATVDLKIQENYISRRILKELGRDGGVQAFKKGTGKVAVLDSLLEPVKVEGWVEMGIVIGSRDGGGGTLLSGLRWNVVDQGALVGVADVVLGTAVLGEVGGLMLGDGQRRVVEEGVKVLGVGHAVEDGGVGTKRMGKDEL